MMIRKKVKQLSPIQEARKHQAIPTPSLDKQKPSDTPQRSNIRYPTTKMRTLKPKTQLKKVGVKGKRQSVYYDKATKEYKEQNPHCEICLIDNIQNPDIDIHHKAGRKGALLWYKPYFMSCCRPHHRYIHDHTKESVEKGWIIRITKQEEDDINERARRSGMY